MFFTRWYILGVVAILIDSAKPISRSSVSVGVYNHNGLNVSSPGDCNDESRNIMSIVQYLIDTDAELSNYVVDNSITSLEDTRLASKLESLAIFIVPKPEMIGFSIPGISDSTGGWQGKLGGWATSKGTVPMAASQAIIRSYVKNGGIVMVPTLNEGTGFINSIFPEWDISLDRPCSGSETVNKRNAAGTSFEGGRFSLGCPPTTYSLNCGAVESCTPIYGHATSSVLALLPFGSGIVIFLGWDFNSSGYATAVPGGMHRNCKFRSNKWITDMFPRALQLAAPPPLIPTAAPTKAPSNPPTEHPTASPTPLPMAASTISHTPGPTQLPSLHSTVPPMMEPTQRPTLPPIVTPTSWPTAAHGDGGNLPRSPTPTSPPTVKSKIDSSQAPTKAPTMTPESALSGGYKAQNTVRGTGQVCSKGKDCKSGTCRNGVCMASSECYPVKHKYGTPFDSNAVNIVFVGSAFDKTTHETWHAQVNTTYAFFRNFNMFSEDIEQLNVFLVDPPVLSSSFCNFGCSGIDRLLCCEISKAQTLSEKCFPLETNLQTVVIHNDKKYGGAGYPSYNIATVSINPSGPEVAVHELGHSLFELGDEYSYFDGGAGTESFPNCDSSNTCDKWSDLIGQENKLPGYQAVKCIPGCSKNKYFVGEESYMGSLSNPVGAVNERFTCCTYQALTKSMPSYCDVFNFSPNYLLDYCKKNDFQLYGASNYDIKPAQYIPESGIQDENTKYLYVTDPMLVKIKLKTNGKAVVKGSPVPLSAGMYPKSQVRGDFVRAKVAAKQGVDSMVKVKVSYRTGKEFLFISRNTTVKVPFPPGRSQDNMPRSVSEKADIFELVLDTKGRRIKRVNARTTKITTKNP